MTGDQLTEQSRAAPWTVAQVLSHLDSGAGLTLQALRAALDDVDRAADADTAVRARWNAMSPRKQAAGYLRAGEKLDEAFAELDTAQRSGLRIPSAIVLEPADSALFAGIRLNEAALRAWDVQGAFDPAAVVPDDAAGGLVEQYQGPLAFLLGSTAKPAELTNRPVTRTVRTTPSDRPLGLSLRDQVRVTDAPGESDGELQQPLATLPRLLAGRLRASEGDRGIRLHGAMSSDDLRPVVPGS